MTDTQREQLIRKQDWIYPTAGRDWRDGLLAGNGNLGVVSYAPSHLEWIVNKVDVFDPTLEEELAAKTIPHDEFLRHLKKQSRKNSLFLNELENAPAEGLAIRQTMSAAVLRLRFWQGSGWSAPATPMTSQHLSLYDGILEERMAAYKFHPVIRSFVPRETNLFCMRVNEPHFKKRLHILELVRPANNDLPVPEWQSMALSIAFLQKLQDGKTSYAVAVLFVPHNEEVVTDSGTHSGLTGCLRQLGDTDIFVAVKTSYESDDPLAAAIAEAASGAARGFDMLEKVNTKWWHNYWGRAYADFGQYKQIQKYFTFGLYEIASVFGKAPMPGLNGLAYGPLDEATPGVMYQAYTHDQNVQIAVMPFFPLDRIDFVKVLADTYLEVVDILHEHTRRLFRCSGIFLPLTMNQLGREYPSKAYRYTLCGSAYSGMILSMAWKYSHDNTLLREKIYPLLREFAEFYIAIMPKGEDGVYHLDWSIPPEIFSLTRDDNATIAMLKVCLETLIETASLVNPDEPLLTRWQDMLSHYPESAKTCSGAFWYGPDIRVDHYFFGGHLLYPFFPTAISDDSKAVRKTLELIETDAFERSFADHTGKWHLNHDWSQFLTTCARLRCGDRQGGWDGLKRFLELFGKENGLFTHDPIIICDPAEAEETARNGANRLNTGRRWSNGDRILPGHTDIADPICVTPNPDAKRLAPAVMEGSSAFLFMAAETLLQSHKGIIRLFPSVPDDFTGSFDHFLTEGAFEVSASMIKGGDDCGNYFPSWRHAPDCRSVLYGTGMY